MQSAIEFAEKGLVPDALVRVGIRRLLSKRINDCRSDSCEKEGFIFSDFIRQMRSAPLALNTAEANSQHYEVPTSFYKYCLGARMKYSSCYFSSPSSSLEKAEEDMLGLTCERAGLKDGMNILELGCGWGSLSLWMAEKYPAANITAVSNSASQKKHIDGVAAARGLKNLTIITCDMNEFSIDKTFDRVVSVEMFEHMRNYQMLFERISRWLNDDGKLFFHIFCHAQFTYPFGTEADDDWMGKNFFTGGIMPAFSLPLNFQEHLKIEQQWKVDGTHYGRTSEEWLLKLDRNRANALKVFKAEGSPADPAIMVNRWRIFFMACAELFKFKDGREWFVGHYLFAKQR
ncbi:MAG: class I SAM-dependent methyltransferase [Proteobacteria bacterium]|nr:class I SAM-dependent methyltransferase [Pseudomonadota bacterium]